MKLKLLLPLLLVPVFAGCGQVVEEVKEKPIVIKEEINPDKDFEKLAQNEAIVYADENFEYFTDGSFIEAKGDDVILHTPQEYAIRDVEGIVELPTSLDPVNEYLSVKRGRVVIIKAVGYPSNNGNTAEMREEISNLNYKEVKYSIKSYKRAVHDLTFSFQKDDDSKIQKILLAKLDPVMEQFRDEFYDALREQGKLERIEEEKRLAEAASETTPSETTLSETIPSENTPSGIAPSETASSIENIPQHTHIWQPVYKTLPAETKTVYEVYDNSTKEVIAVVETQEEADKYENAAYRSKEETVKEEEKVIDYYKCVCGEKYSP